MRVRFYEVGGSAHAAVLRCDEFPATLGVDGNGRLTQQRGQADPLCVVDNRDGLLEFRLSAKADQALVNNAPLERGPLLPGDQLQVQGRTYVVSYERTADPPMPESRFRSAYSIKTLVAQAR
jgi:hypothetical protein